MTALLALVLAAAPDVHGRLVVSAASGGGWSSDPYLGSGLGSGGMAELQPGARLDLSLSPVVKAAVTADGSLLRFGAGAFAARSGSGSAELRLLGRDVEASLAVRGEVARYPLGAPAGDSGEGPIVSSATSLSATPTVRLRSANATLWASVAGTIGNSRTAVGDVAERGVAANVGCAWKAGEKAALFASARTSRVGSADPGFALRAAAGDVGVSAQPAGALELTARAGVDHIRFDAGVVQDLVRGTVELAHPVGPVTAVVSWAGAWTDAGVLGEHSRHLLYAGVRYQTGVFSW